MTPFKERMNLYRAYREQNPDKNYWDWKASIDNAGKLAQQFRTRTNKPNFVERLEDPNRQTIPSWEDDTSVATHRLSYATYDDGSAVIYPEVQQIGNELYDFTDPTNRQTRRDAYQSALNRGDVVWVPTEQDAVDFTTQYKNHYPTFSKGSPEVPAMQGGGNTEDYVGQQIDQYALQEAINQTGRDLYIADHTDPETGVVSPFYNKGDDTYGTYQLPDLTIKPEYKSAQQMERALNAAAANRGRQYYHDAMREIDAGRRVAELAEWTPIGDVVDLTKAGIAASQGDYQTAGMMAGMMFLPNFIQKPALGYRYLRRKASQKFGAPNVEFYENMVRDVVTRPAETIQARREGRYPLTYKERRDYLENARLYGDQARLNAVQNQIDRYEARNGQIGYNADELINMYPEFYGYSLQGRSFGKFDNRNAADGVYLNDHRNHKTQSRIATRLPNSNILQRTHQNADGVDFTIAHEITHGTQDHFGQDYHLGRIPGLSDVLSTAKTEWGQNASELQADLNAIQATLSHRRFSQLSQGQKNAVIDYISAKHALDVDAAENAISIMDAYNF